MILPVNERILVKEVDFEKYSGNTSTIIKVEKEKSSKFKAGIVISTSNDFKNYEVNQGSIVLFIWTAGTRVKHDGEEHLLLKESDLFALLEKEYTGDDTKVITNWGLK